MKQADYKYMEERPWGKFYVIQETNNYKIKRIEVNSNQRLSYQYHKKRSEIWTILEGEGTITINDNIIKYKKGDVFQIPRLAKHRIQSDNCNTVFIEVQIGEYFGEDDIVRIEDDYNR